MLLYMRESYSEIPTGPRHFRSCTRRSSKLTPDPASELPPVDPADVAARTSCHVPDPEEPAVALGVDDVALGVDNLLVLDDVLDLVDEPAVVMRVACRQRPAHHARVATAAATASAGRPGAPRPKVLCLAPGAVSLCPSGWATRSGRQELRPEGAPTPRAALRPDPGSGVQPWSQKGLLMLLRLLQVQAFLATTACRQPTMLSLKSKRRPSRLCTRARWPLGQSLPPSRRTL